MNLATILEYEEGFRYKPYLCSEGYVTIGLGTKLHNEKGLDPSDFPISVSRKIAFEWLETEVALKDQRMLNDWRHQKVYQNLDNDRRAVILSMAYQMGTSGVKKFNKMWLALSKGDHKMAAMQALDSRWAKQTPARAERVARVLAGESLEEVFKHINK
tara:strand:- start:910 stop:1383 length:474 start_codon:yes stop_codon:yes gene_type:complete